MQTLVQTALLTLLFSTTFAADFPIAQAHVTAAPPRIDGVLNDWTWSKAVPVSGFLQREPAEGAPASERTEVRILRDDDNLYLGFRCFDAQPEQIIATVMRRDGNLGDDDNVQVVLDTYNDRRGGFYFATNPLGARLDASLSSEGRTRNESWDCVWSCRAQIDSLGWTAEIAIPLDQLRYAGSENATWGINLARTIRRKNERAFLVPPPLAYGFSGHYRTSRLGTLTSLGRLEERPRLEITPYAQAGTTRDFEALDTDAQYKLDSGIDLKYGVTPAMTLDLSWRTDFAQVEADQEQVNLTRFSLFLPEKRDFFLEGAGIFSFGERVQRSGGGSRPPTLLFYSRRIGLEEGHALPVFGGGKLTGRSGPFEIGVLNITTEAIQFRDEETEDRYVNEAGLLFAEDDPLLEQATIVDTVDFDFVDTTRVRQTNFSVVRLRRDILSRSSIGLIAVNRDPGGETDYNRSLGLDADFSLLDAALNIRGFAARTFSPDHQGREDAGHFAVDYRRGAFESNASYLDVGEDFNPEVGFVPRDGIRRYRTTLRYRPLHNTAWIRRYSIGPEFTYLTDLDNQLQTRDFGFSAYVNLETGDWLGLRLRQRFEDLDESFEIHEAIDIPDGEHNLTAYSLNFFSDEGRRLSSDGSIEVGDFWTGERFRFSTNSTIKVNSRFSLSADYEFNSVTLPEGDFKTNALSNRFLYTFSTDLFLRGLVQWNSKREVVGINALCNWRYRPGSDLFLVYSQAWDTDGGGQLNRLLQCKLTYFWKH